MSPCIIIYIMFFACQKFWYVAKWKKVYTSLLSGIFSVNTSFNPVVVPWYEIIHWKMTRMEISLVDTQSMSQHILCRITKIHTNAQYYRMQGRRNWGSYSTPNISWNRWNISNLHPQYFWTEGRCHAEKSLATLNFFGLKEGTTRRSQ